MKNEKSPLRLPPKGEEKIRATMREKCTVGKGGKGERTSLHQATQRTKGRREGKERKERNGGAARSANLGGCKGRAANGGEGKRERRGRREGGGRKKSGRFNRPEKEERSDAREQRVKKRIADTIGTKNIKFYFIGRKTPENLHMCNFCSTFARRNVQ